MRGGLLGFRTEAVALLAALGFVCLVRFEDLVRVRVAIASLLDKNSLTSFSIARVEPKKCLAPRSLFTADNGQRARQIPKRVGSPAW